DQKGGKLTSAEWDRLLYWHVHVFLWGRYAGSTESVLAQDINAVKGGEGIDGLLRLIKTNRPDLSLHPDDFWGWSAGARLYPLMYLLARMGHARDWGNGIELNSHLLGKNSSLDVHHIFPKKVLYAADRNKSMVNQLANYAFLTKETNLEISDKLPQTTCRVTSPQTPERSNLTPCRLTTLPSGKSRTTRPSSPGGASFSPRRPTRSYLPSTEEKTWVSCPPPSNSRGPRASSTTMTRLSPGSRTG
ncbi:MAG: hypothetical protein ACLTXI_02520, partial [Collinsella sp.]